MTSNLDRVLVGFERERGPHVEDVEIVHMMTMGTAPYVSPEMAGHFRHNAVFIGANVRDAINDGRADYTPIYLSEIEELFESGAMRLFENVRKTLFAGSIGRTSRSSGVSARS